MFTSMAKSGAKLVVLLVMLALLVPGVANAGTLFYEDFSDGLNDWTYGGPVALVNEVSPPNSWPRLRDLSSQGNPYLYYNAVAIPGVGDYLYEFDLYYQVRTGALDSFTATLFYTNTLDTFDPRDRNNVSSRLFVVRNDNQGQGPVMYEHQHPDVTITNGGTWKHIAFDFTNPNGYNYVIPYFTISKNGDPTANFTAGVDNVRITDKAPVPEPATSVIMGMGLLGLGIVRKRFKK